MRGPLESNNNAANGTDIIAQIRISSATTLCWLQSRWKRGALARQMYMFTFHVDWGILNVLVLPCWWEALLRREWHSTAFYFAIVLVGGILEEGAP